MDEKKILDKLREDAQTIEVPDELKPEQIEKMLESVKQMQTTWEDENANTSEQENADAGKRVKPRRVRSRHMMRKYTKRIAAAAVAIVCIGGAYGVSRMQQMGSEQDDAFYVEDVTGQEHTEEANEIVLKPHISVASLGDMYTRAADYGEVYDKVEELKEPEEELTFGGVVNDFFERVESVIGGDDMKTSDSIAMEDGAVMEESVSDSEPEAALKSEYSGTNLMTAGVDESDIVKTDGEYIYKLENNRISITDIRNGQMKEVALVQPPSDSATDMILEMYVDEDQLIIITQQEDVGMEVGQMDMDVDQEVEDVLVDVYEMDGGIRTVTYIYDITEPSAPKLEDTITQDGTYHTSRKIGDILYVFTDYRLQLPDEKRTSAVTEEGATDWIPSVGDTVVPAECIYLPETGNSALFISSVDVTKPDQMIDMKMIVSDWAQIYVSNSSIYIYENDYNTETNCTKIAKFSMEKGVIEGVDAASVNGEVLDAFAINEYQGYLRVLTTIWSGYEETNSVYVLDADMRLVGELEGIAPGEEIYSARFLNDTGYFVTYRNTDPLFTVDLSNPTSPKILGELKVTGFSEYLHFWGEDKLLGIGYETDPDTGENLGIKLSMFDISNPENVTEESRIVLKGDVYSNAMSDYKSVLVNEQKNVIGFAIEDYGEYNWKDADDEEYGYGIWYVVYSYEDGQFVQKLSRKMQDYILQNCRGLYAKDTFYLIGDETLESYDMKNQYQKLEQSWVRLEE